MIAAVVMCRNENAYLHEWCEWHYAIGFDKLLIFDDHSNIPLIDTVSTFPKVLREATEVHIVRDTIASRQLLVYLSAVVNLGPKYEWMAFIDTDEFIIPKQDDNIYTLLSRYKNYGALVINWQMFGANGKLTRDKDENQIDSLVWKATENNPVNRHVKSIIQPGRIKRKIPSCPHFFFYKNGHHAVNCQGIRVDGPFVDVNIEVAQINHYYFRSKREYMEKVARGKGDMEGFKDKTLFDKIDGEYSQVEDLTAVRFKKNLSRLGWIRIKTPYLGV